MRKKFLWAGALNIACAVLGVLSFVFVFVILSINAYGDAEDLFGLLMVSTYVLLIFSYYQEVFTLLPMLTVLTGIEFLSKHKKGAGTKVLIVINVIVKAIETLVWFEVGAAIFLSADVISLAYGAYLIFVGLVHLVSCGVDIYAWPRKKVKGHYGY